MRNVSIRPALRVRRAPAESTGSKTRREERAGPRGQGLVPGGFAVPGKGFVHLGVRQLGEAGEDIGEPCLPDDAIELGGDDEGVHRRSALDARSRSRRTAASVCPAPSRGVLYPRQNADIGILPPSGRCVLSLGDARATVHGLAGRRNGRVHRLYPVRDGQAQPRRPSSVARRCAQSHPRATELPSCCRGTALSIPLGAKFPETARASSRYAYSTSHALCNNRVYRPVRVSPDPLPPNMTGTPWRLTR